MGSVCASYDISKDYADWDFTADYSERRPEYSDIHLDLMEAQNRSNDSINVCSDFNCFTGMAVAIPLSLMAWAGIIALLYLLIRHLI